MEQEILKIVETFCGHSVTPEDNLIDDLGLDSLDVIDVTMKVEKKYSIRIDDAAVAHFKIVNDIIDVTKKLC